MADANAEPSTPSDSTVEPTIGEAKAQPINAQELRSLVTFIRGAQKAIEKKADAVEAAVARVEKARAEAKGKVADIETLLAAARAGTESLPALVQEITSGQGQLQTIRAELQAAVATTQDKAAEITASATRLAATATDAEQHGVTIQTKSQHIQQSLEHAQNVKNKIDQLETAAQASANKAEGKLQSATTLTESIAAALSEAQTSKASIESTKEQIDTLLEDAEEHTSAVKKLADRAEVVDKRVADYEASLAKMIEEHATLKLQIEGLLPGATSAGLASAFNKRRVSFERPQQIWQLVFVVCVIGLCVVGIFELRQAAEVGAPALQSLYMSLLRRLPFAVPLIWLAIYAARQAGLAKQLEEEYAYKEAVSTAFEGYRKQMAELDEELAETSPLGRLCMNTLTEIGRPPGRIYDKHRTDPSPATALADSAAPISQAAATLLGKK